MSILKFRDYKFSKYIALIVALAIFSLDCAWAQDALAPLTKFNTGEMKSGADESDMVDKKELDDYEARLAERNIRRYETEEYEVSRLENHPKFYPNGQTKPFYGLTCITRIKPGTKLHRKLYSLQAQLKEALKAEGMEDVFSFLEPDAFHMTICDIDPSAKYNKDNKPNIPVSQQQFEERLGQVKEAFEVIGSPGQISARIKGLGLKGTITATVRFSDVGELRKVSKIEATIKEKIGVSVRKFAGHISLAYVVKYPEGGHERFKKVIQILRRFEDADLGDFTFDDFDLTYFSDMNHYIPLVTKNLKDGGITEHDSNMELVKAGILITFASTLSGCANIITQHPTASIIVGVISGVGLAVAIFFASWRIFFPVSWFIWTADMRRDVDWKSVKRDDQQALEYLRDLLAKTPAKRTFEIVDGYFGQYSGEEDNPVYIYIPKAIRAIEKRQEKRRKRKQTQLAVPETPNAELPAQASPIPAQPVTESSRPELTATQRELSELQEGHANEVAAGRQVVAAALEQAIQDTQRRIEAIEEANRQLANSETTLQEKNTAITRLQGEIEALETSLAEQNKAYQDAEAVFKNAQATYKGIAETVNELKMGYELEVQSSRSASAEAIKNVLDVREEQLKGAEQFLAEKQKEARDAEAQVKVVTSELQAKRAQLAALGQEVDSLNAQIAQWHQTLFNLEAGGQLAQQALGVML